jgi:signal transduction histidine kinase
MNRKRLLSAIHLLWWIVLVLSLSVFLVSKWEGYSLLQSPCEQPLHCGSSMQLTKESAADLARYGIATAFYGSLLVVFMTIANLSHFVIGGLLYWYRRRDLYGLAASFFLIVTGTIFCTDEAALGGYPAVLRIFHLLDGIGSFYLPFLFLFPDGRFVPKWTILPALLWALAQTYRFIEPAAWTALTWDPMFMTVLLILTHGPLLYSLLYRRRRSGSPAERRHIAWFLFAVLSYVAGGMLFALSYVLQDGVLQLVFQTAFFAGLLFWPFSIGVSALERQPDAIHRTILVSTMSFLLVGLFAAAVGGLSLLLRQDDMLVSMIASGVIAVLFHPLYMRLKRSANRLVYGELESPYQTLVRLVERMDTVVEREAVWEDVARGIAQALRIPYVSIVRGTGQEVVLALYGQAGGSVTDVPLEKNGERVGTMKLGYAGSLRESMPSETEELLRHLVRQVSAALHAEGLTEELRQSRERLVTAREEERRRFGRDLHDGLGAGLASVLLRTDAIVDDCEGSDELRRQLAGIQSGLEDSIAEVRRLAYMLRPPVLDEFGLRFALQEIAARNAGKELRVDLDIPDELPSSSAAAEMAVYRIAQEALTNAIRHGRAGHCRISLRCPGTSAGIELTVEDDGCGIAQPVVPGIGIRSMRERAEELGGTLRLQALDGRGTSVRAFIPFTREGADDGRGTTARARAGSGSGSGIDGDDPAFAGR